MKERVFIVGLKTAENLESYDKSMEELYALAESAGAEVISRVDQTGQPNPRTFIGSGKVEELKEMAENIDIDSIIINSELSGSQIKNLETAIGKKIIDRTNLILDIFATRARTKESVLQVSLAQAEYMLPRLEGYSDHLSRTGGGIGTRGPGEQQLETDRRHIRNQISRIRKKLKSLEKNRETTSKRRIESQTPIVSLIGYTNVGKSTIMNKIMELTEREEDTKVYADDRLFATLQTSNRRVEYKDTTFILADTVGLIEDLPINLIEAFKSTLEDASYSDLLLIVIDASTDNLDRQISSISDLIESLQLGHIPKIIVYNKIDLIEENLQISTGISSVASIEISAEDKKGIETLLDTIVSYLNKDKKKVKLLIPYDDYSLYSSLLDEYEPSLNEAVEEGMLIEINIDENLRKELEEYEAE